MPSSNSLAVALGRTPSSSSRRSARSVDFVNAQFREETEVIATDDLAARPRSPSLAPALSDAEIEAVNARLADAGPEEILDWAITRLGRDLYQTTAFGLTGLVALDIISRISTRRAPVGSVPRHLVPLIFIDTLYHFSETLALAGRAQRKYAADLHVYKPEGAVDALEFERRYGAELWKTDEDSYDYMVKVEPARRAYNELGVRAVITGRRRSQGGDRARIPVVEKDETGLVKINPLAAWTFADTKRYIDEHQVPYNELLDRGYTSVGDWHSTKPVKGVSAASVDLDAAERSGRWADKAEKVECGLHKDYFKLKAAAAKKKREREQAERDAARDKVATIEADLRAMNVTVA